MPDGAMRPLMELLIGLSTNIQVVPDIANVANDHGLHARFIQRGNKSAGLLVFDILDLVFQFAKLLMFGTKELLASTGAFLLPIDLLIQLL